MFTDFNTTEAMWFLMSSKTAEPNPISLPRNCSIVTKFMKMRNKCKMKNNDTGVLANDTHFFGDQMPRHINLC